MKQRFLRFLSYPERPDGRMTSLEYFSRLPVLETTDLILRPLRRDLEETP